MLDNPLKEDAFKLKGRLFTLTVLEVHDSQLSRFQASLEAVVKKAPKMFSNTPVVLDLSPLKGASFDLKGLSEKMREFQMVPVAVQGASVIQQKAAVNAGLAIIASNSKKDIEIKADVSVPVATPAPSEPVAKEPESKQDDNKAKSPEMPTRSKVVTMTVRSGQQVYAKDADLIVLASVSRGAELLADGHIHVYGALRGRALAGLNGNENARIFCSNLDAELVSIAGQYLIPEKGEGNNKLQAKQVCLHDGHIRIIDL